MNKGHFVGIVCVQGLVNDLVCGATRWAEKLDF